MDGILLLDKPSGWTSHDLVAKLRYKIGQKKIGHAGTLDPMATGLMILLLGKSTKDSDRLLGLDKGYAGDILLGVETDSWDRDGKVLRESEVPQIEEKLLAEIFNKFLGEQLWMPPAFSAIKKQGSKAYELARKGQDPGLELRPMRIDRLDLVQFKSPYVSFDLLCSKGTYVRSLAMELGKALKLPATLSRLVRTQIGSYTLAQAVTVDEILKLSTKQIEDRLIQLV